MSFKVNEHRSSLIRIETATQKAYAKKQNYRFRNANRNQPRVFYSQVAFKWVLTFGGCNVKCHLSLNSSYRKHC